MLLGSGHQHNFLSFHFFQSENSHIDLASPAASPLGCNEKKVNHTHIILKFGFLRLVTESLNPILFPSAFFFSHRQLWHRGLNQKDI